MLFLILHIILISGFGLILKAAQNRGHRLNPVGFINYLTAFLISIWSASEAGRFEFTKLTLAFGLTNGVAYSTGFLLVTLGMRLSGIVVTIAVVRLSLVVPIVFAILFWNEIPNFRQALGIIMACCALPLLGTKSPVSRDEKETGRVESNSSRKQVRKKPSAFPIGQEATGLGLLVVALLFINSGIS
ncbi:MAG: hypothetical protein O7E52_26470, partial [Candidatus Poribacteria bacterium]|nr:hypothetical protein [Candidatus Poribacteria bacterium]